MKVAEGCTSADAQHNNVDMKKGRDAAALKAEFLSACSGVFDRFVSPEGKLLGSTFSEIEESADEQFRFLAVLLSEKRLTADPLADPEGHFMCPKCARRMRVQNRAQERTLPGTLGNVEMIRPYCVCDSCGFSCAPLDYALGIPVKGASVGRRELVCNAATKDRSFEKARKTLSHHSKICLSDEGIRKLAESEGRRLVDARAKRVRECFEKRGHFEQNSSEPVSLLVVVCDGGMVQTRNKKERWKSDKVGCVYNAVAEPNKSAAMSDEYQGAKALKKTYVATMEPWVELGRMLFTEACARGYFDAREKVFLSDGAESIVDLRKEHFSDACAIIDWYHAAEHLYSCSKAAFGFGTAEYRQWATDTKDLLWKGKLQDVIEAIRKESERAGRPPPGAPDADPRVVLHRNVGYFTNNHAEMDYPTYRARGWPIGSGVAEGSVKRFALRVKGSEQFWNLWGVEEMLALCELYFSEDDRWVDYWKARSQPPEDAFVLIDSDRLDRPPGSSLPVTALHSRR